MRNIGEIISSSRKKMKLSQPMLAELLQEEGINLSVKAISKWETNATEPGVSTFMTVCKVLNITDIYEAYFGVNPANPLSSLNDEGKEKALDYIELLHDSGKYEKQTAKIIPFCRFIDVYENAVSAGTGNFLVDGPKETIQLTKDVIPEAASYGVKISGDSMEPEFEDGQIAWVLKQDFVENGEIGIFSLNGEAYIKKLQDDKNGVFLISLNVKYPPIPVGENDRFDILGKVVGKNHPSELKEYLQ